MMRLATSALDRAGNPHLWLPGYLSGQYARRNQAAPKRVWLTIADHFEPLWNHPSEEVAEKRVRAWLDEWPRIAARHVDTSGHPAVYTFFYAQEEYRPHLLDMLAEMTGRRIADVEIHLHHDGEGREDFVERMREFIAALRRKHGLLHQRLGRPGFGFIHGDWALDNSRPDGMCCGLNDEITILRDLGCYADFTLPSAPHATQTRMVNQIYWATDDPDRPRSHETGTPVRPGEPASGDLMMIPGPLAICRWGGMRPHLETGEIGQHWPVNKYRVKAWLGAAPRIGEDLFLKLFTHGTQEQNSAALLGGELDRCLDLLQAACRECGSEIHFVSAWNMWRAVEALRESKNPVTSIAERDTSAVR